MLSQFIPDKNGTINVTDVTAILSQIETTPAITHDELADFERDSSKNGKICAARFIRKFLQWIQNGSTSKLLNKNEFLVK